MTVSTLDSGSPISFTMKWETETLLPTVYSGILEIHRSIHSKTFFSKEPSLKKE